jgi:hypothetical protein
VQALCFDFDQNMDLATFWAIFFTNSSGHSAPNANPLIVLFSVSFVSYVGSAI